MVINQKLAALMFPDQDPLGQQIRPEKDGPSYRVIGIAADVRNDGLTQQTLPEYDTLLGAISGRVDGSKYLRWDASYPKCVVHKNRCTMDPSTG